MLKILIFLSIFFCQTLDMEINSSILYLELHSLQDRDSIKVYFMINLIIL
jgi:hypothetical protein